MRSLLFFLLAFQQTLTAASEDFRPLLDQAVRESRNAVTIPPGTYRLKPAVGSGTHVLVKNARNLTINAKGVTLICEDLTRAVTLADCRNVTIKGLQIDYDPLPFTQGTVVKVAEDFAWIDVKLAKGYPRKPYSRIDIVDAKTRFRKRGMPFLWGTTAKMSSDGLVRISLRDIGKIGRIGDLASMSTGPRPGGVPHAVAIENCSGTVFEDIAVLAAPGFGIIEQDGEGGMQYYRCKVVPGPKPPGATEERLLSSTWDAMQSKTMKRGPIVEQCEIREAGDDSWSVQSSDYLVVDVEGSTAILTFRDQHCAGPQPGDRLTNSLNAKPVIISGVRATTLPAAVRKKVSSAKPWTLWKTSE